MNFITVDPGAANISGASLLTPIKTTTERIKELFSTCDGDLNEHDEYGPSCSLRHTPTGEVFTIYTRDGEWRIGGFRGACTTIGELMELIEPERYADCAGKTLAEIGER